MEISWTLLKILRILKNRVISCIKYFAWESFWCHGCRFWALRKTSATVRPFHCSAWRCLRANWRSSSSFRKLRIHCTYHRPRDSRNSELPRALKCIYLWTKRFHSNNYYLHKMHLVVEPTKYDDILKTASLMRAIVELDFVIESIQWVLKITQRTRQSCTGQQINI